MPLCDMCKSEADIVVRKSFGEDKPIRGKRIQSKPPHGMEWGEECSRCDAKAEVIL